MLSKSKLYLTAVIIALIVVGGISIIYQNQKLGLPWSPGQQEDVWTIEAKIQFKARSHRPVKAKLLIPKLDRQYESVNETFLSKNYGFNVREKGFNRQVDWYIRRAAGSQTLYYRLTVFNKKELKALEEKAYVAPFDSNFEPTGSLKIATDALLENTRNRSSDVSSFTIETIKTINDRKNLNANLLVKNYYATEHLANVIVNFLSLAKIPAKVVYTVDLVESRDLKPTIKVASFNGKRWHYFDPKTAIEGLARNTLIWGYDGPLVRVDGGSNAIIKFSAQKEPMNAVDLALNMGEKLRNKSFGLSLFSLPVHTQQLYQIVLLVPVGVFIILLLRVFVGLETIGTFMPILIALAFRETQVFYGVLLFSLITAIGLIIRKYLDSMRLLAISRLGVMLTMVVITMAAISVFANKLGLESGLSIALFPMVILTMTIERISILQEERGAYEALEVSLGSLIAAIICYFVMFNKSVEYFMYSFPGTLLILIGLMLLIGRYSGYRLSELIRFREFIRAK